MPSALSIQKYLALNRGRYSHEVVKLPRINSNIYLTTHLEIAATNLLHYHETAHLHFILNGGMIDRRKNSETERISSELTFFHAGELHESIYRGFPVRNITIELEADFFRKNSVSEADLYLSVSQNPTAKFNMLKVYKEILAKDEFSHSSIDMLLLGLIEAKNVYERVRPLWINKVSELLHDNWDKELSVQDLALVANVHPKTISKYFSKYFACTLGEYRRKIKVEKALTLIKTSKLTLTEIAYECGFYDQSHFTGIFKELTGFLPKQFKKI
jgi:AraC family transcriptional regulator